MYSMLTQVSFFLKRVSSPRMIRFWPCLTSLILVIVFLQVLHIALLSRLEEKEAKLRENKSVVSRQLQGRMLKNVISEMEERIKTSHRFDKSGTYYILDNFLTSEHVVLGRSEYDVSIVTQGSSDHLHFLVDLSQQWNGPISASVFTYDDNFVNTISSLIHFHFCNDHIYRHVSFHLVYPISRAPKPIDALSDLRLACDDHISKNKNIQLYFPIPNYASRYLEYPGNLLRNLAINYAQTPYIFTIDMDFLPSENVRTDFQRFMSSNVRLSRGSNISDSKQSLNILNSLSAFVVPAFEIKESNQVPREKGELLKLWMSGVVRPFYSEICQKCQSTTNYEAWRGLDNGSSIRVGYTVERSSIWKPFYIAKTSLPLFDERFKQYGYDRISQVCEMDVAGFTFHVLDNAFIVRRGFSHRNSFHDNKDANYENNKQLFMKFQEELKIKYPQTAREC